MAAITPAPVRPPAGLRSRIPVGAPRLATLALLTALVHPPAGIALAILVYRDDRASGASPRPAVVALVVGVVALAAYTVATALLVAVAVGLLATVASSG